ncbi:hypothetical protein [Kibdelosporangium phytohabitans]|uniref:hypothetical protein n=1 Tax=Kibdelosporangium phytohabitans TaxID=860235 RepID=UPI0007C6B5C7|nr:hypothetical protein [Kibdelosporangium phytohabitans]
MGHRARVLLVDQATYRWTLSHSHRADNADGGTPRYHDCAERLVIRRDNEPGRLEIVFASGEGTAGATHVGEVKRGDDYLNLNRPGVVRAVLGEAIDRGWLPAEPGRCELDGWALVDSVLTRLAEQRNDRPR